MDTLFHRLLRPTLRTSRLLASVVVLTLVGWLGVTAGHLHLPGGEATGLAAALHAGHSHADGHAHADPGPLLDGADDHPAGERVHPCSLCATMDRTSTPAPTVALVVAVAPPTHPVAAPAAPVASQTTVAVYRSRAPPSA
jgi:hypothetical protein